MRSTRPLAPPTSGASSATINRSRGARALNSSTVSCILSLSRFVRRAPERGAFAPAGVDREPIGPHAGWRQIAPDRPAAMREVAPGADLARNGRSEAVGELNEHARPPHQRKGVADELFAPS